jgi:elongation factor Ts
VDGKIDKFYQQICLEEQEFIRESGMKVLDHVKALAGKLGENVQINRFARFEIGEGEDSNQSC